MKSIVYNKEFYDNQREGSSMSAQAVWPVVFELIQPKSVIDIGCGVGTWLKCLEDFQISHYLGVDGDYVDTEKLIIPKEKFVSYDLTAYYKASEKFDLAMSLEVGEHLPDATSDSLVKTLTDASDFVLFSAALPGQKGTYHINEQWPEYWAKKFAAQNFVAVDCIRKKIWKNTKIETWYRQNIVLYVKEDVLSLPGYEHLQDLAKKTDADFLTRIHPELFAYYQQKLDRISTFEGFARLKLAKFKKKR